MRWKWNVEDFEKLFNLLAFNVSKPLWFHDLNVTIKIKTAVIMKTTPMMKMLMIFLMRMMKFQKVLFFILILKTWCKLEKMILLKQMVQFTSFSSYITKELGKYHWSSWGWFGHKYHPGSNICGKYLEIFKDN